MKLSPNTFTAILLFLSNAQQSIAIPQPIADVQLVQERTPRAEEVFADGNALIKRKGGGGGGGKGGGGGSGGKGGSGSSGSSSSSSGKGLGSSGSNAGGRTKTGSGVQPSYGGGRYYGGGATTPYSAGGISPLGIAPVLILSAGLAFWSTAWLYGAYEYPYHHPYTFHNRTATNETASNTTTAARSLSAEPILLSRQATTGGMNQTKPVICFCALYAECGCDDNGDTTFLDSLIGDGTYANLNLSLVDVGDVNGTSTILLNGTLPNGTTTSGGTEDANAAIRSVSGMTGYWVMVALVGAMVYLV